MRLFIIWESAKKCKQFRGVFLFLGKNFQKAVAGAFGELAFGEAKRIARGMENAAKVLAIWERKRYTM